jgi:hypothetical protein
VGWLVSKVRQVLRQLALPTGLSADELLATYREPLMNGLQMSVKMWGTFETELLRSITDAIHAHPTSGDVRRLLSLVLEVVARTGEHTQARCKKKSIQIKLKFNWIRLLNKNKLFFAENRTIYASAYFWAQGWCAL